MKTPNKYGWFEEKHYGWGWMPVKWQGWAVIAVYVGLVYQDVKYYYNPAASVADNLEVLGARLIVETIVLIAICYLTGGWPRWCWGDRIWK